MTPFVLPLDDRRAADASQVGPKAAHLSALMEMCAVPDGFCITAAAYRHAAVTGGLAGEVEEAVRAAYAKLVGDEAPLPPLAVRSSALDEDGPTASFAGQHETILDVVGIEAVLAAIERTWSSLHAPAAIAYRRAHGLPLGGLALAVLVQRLVPADRSGVAFSVDPVSGRTDRIVVNASWGLGESMVNGTVTPDTWHLDKSSLAVIEERLANKERMTIASGEGVREVIVPSFLRERASLDATSLEQVAALTRRLETVQGWPVDLEFAYAGAQLFLLQCRPVTTHAGKAATPAVRDALPDPWSETGDSGRFWERDLVHFPGQLTMLDQALVRMLFDHGVNHGAHYYDLPFRMTARTFWTYHYNSEWRYEQREPEAEAREARVQLVLDELEEAWQQRWAPAIHGALEAWSSFDLTGASLEGLIGHLDASWERAHELWAIHFEIVMPLGRAKSLFSELYNELFEPDGTLPAHELLQGFDTLTTVAGRRLWALRDVALRVPGAAELLASTPSRDALAALERIPEAEPLLDAIRDYLNSFGQRSPTIELAVPTLAEDPTPVMKTLAQALATPGRDLERDHADRVQERERRTEEARSSLRGYPAPVRDEFERRLANAQTAARLGEDHNFLIDFRSTAELRRVFMEFGRRFAVEGVLARADDVVHLEPDEVRETALRLPDLDRRGVVAERKAELERYATLDPPATLGERPEGSPAPPPPSGAAQRRMARDGILTGTPGSAGFVRGRARVLRSLADAERLQPGEVLVAPTTSQPWMPLFATAAALVTEAGGVLSHAAVVAREYRLPAVVGVAGATHALHDGQLVEVDGERGLVRIVDAS